MKKIIIAGIPRAGKTTLAKKIFDHYPYHLIQSDSLNAAIGEMYTKYIAKKEEKEEMCTFFINSQELINIQNDVLELYFNISAQDYNYMGVILDTSCLSMKKLKEYEKEGCIVIVLGCADITTDEFIENIRTYDTPLDRTYYLGNFRLRMEIEPYVEISQKYKKECEELGLTYIETSHDREASLEKAYQIIQEKLEES